VDVHRPTLRSVLAEGCARSHDLTAPLNDDSTRVEIARELGTLRAANDVAHVGVARVLANNQHSSPPPTQPPGSGHPQGAGLSQRLSRGSTLFSRFVIFTRAERTRP
jgi:hypothetical protein